MELLELMNELVTTELTNLSTAVYKKDKSTHQIGPTDHDNVPKQKRLQGPSQHPKIHDNK